MAFDGVWRETVKVFVLDKELEVQGELANSDSRPTGAGPTSSLRIRKVLSNSLVARLPGCGNFLVDVGHYQFVRSVANGVRVGFGAGNGGVPGAFALTLPGLRCQTGRG